MASTMAAGAESDALSKYKAIAHKLRSVLESTQAELKDKTAKLAALSTSGESGLLQLLVADADAGISFAVRVPHDGRTFLLITAADGRFEWKAEHEVLAAYPDLESRIAATPFMTSALDASNLRSAAAEAQDQLRVFRVRAEALLRQRDNELATLRQRLQQTEADRIIGADDEIDGGGSGTERVAGSLASESHAGHGQSVDRLLRIQHELREREARARDAVAELSTELQSTREQLAALRARFGVVDGSDGGGGSGGSQQSSAASSSSAGIGGAAATASATAATQSADANALSLSYKKLEEEYTAYRKRAVGLIKQRDDQIGKLSDDLNESKQKLRQTIAEQEGNISGSSSAGVITSPATGRVIGRGAAGGPSPEPSNSGSSSSNMSNISPDAKLAYIRRLLVKYLTADASDASLRLPIENALMTVVDLPPSDLLQIKRARDTAASASLAGHGSAATEAAATVASAAVDLLGGLWSTASSLIGGGSSGAATQAPAPSASPAGGVASPSPHARMQPVSGGLHSGSGGFSFSNGSHAGGGGHGGQLHDGAGNASPAQRQLNFTVASAGIR